MTRTKSYLAPRAIRMYRPMGGGKAVAVYLPSGYAQKNVTLEFSRKIDGTIVENGNIRPIVCTRIRRRGGKIDTSVTLSYDAAYNLHSVLGRALDEAYRRRTTVERVIQLYSEMCHLLSDTGRKVPWRERMTHWIMRRLESRAS